jgi:zona occludens toxin
MIELITGLPGHGKTLYTLYKVKGVGETSARTVYHNEIPGLSIPGWISWPADKWEELPPNSIYVIDESQFAFPVRGRGEPPPHVSALATHRHKGIDIYLVTQNPMLIDSFVRRLIDHHFHIVRKFGTRFATIHEYVNGCRDSVAASRGDSIKHEWRYPSEVFGWYKSAEVHTVKRRLPFRLFLLLGVIALLPALAWFIYARLHPDAVAERVSGVHPGQDVAVHHLPGSGTLAKTDIQGQSLSMPEWLALHVPRVPDLPHTAPIYDALTVPTAAPYPAACISDARRCWCYTASAVRISAVSDKTCRDLVAHGLDIPQERHSPNSSFSQDNPPPRSPTVSVPEKSSPLPLSLM